MYVSFRMACCAVILGMVKGSLQQGWQLFCFPRIMEVSTSVLKGTCTLFFSPEAPSSHFWMFSTWELLLEVLDDIKNSLLLKILENLYLMHFKYTCTHVRYIGTRSRTLGNSIMWLTFISNLQVLSLFI